MEKGGASLWVQGNEGDVEIRDAGVGDAKGCGKGVKVCGRGG